ncbi:MLH2 [Auxenochlorella protothecoides x Auxenochlorella symbiontica]
MAPSIRAIDATSVHRICSGQVILDLSTAVKELLENALDAGATAIEVKLKESGSELIEVADNGTGVSPADYEALTLKYHTSKISQFTDLQGLSSYGFRGEALSSLCTVADVSVVTRTAGEAAGTRLDFDERGRLVGRAAVPRAVGTTVAVRNLFARLPVRHREFKASLRREFSKLTHCLQAYALVARGVRLIATHQQGSGPRATVVATQGSTDAWSDVIAVFGPKAAAGLQTFSADLSEGVCGGGADAEGGREGGTEQTDPSFRVTGYVSRPGMGGRMQGERQFFSLNGRPVDLPRFAKALNEAFRSLSSQASADARPSAVLDLVLPTDAYDINLAPNKRQVALHGENALLARFKEALQALWEPSRHTFAVNGAGRSVPGSLTSGLHAVKRQRLSLTPPSQDSQGGDGAGHDDDEEEEEGGEEEEQTARPGDTGRPSALGARSPVAPGLASFAMPGARSGRKAGSGAVTAAPGRAGEPAQSLPRPMRMGPLAAFGFLPTPSPPSGLARPGGTSVSDPGPMSTQDDSDGEQPADVAGVCAATLTRAAAQAPAPVHEAAQGSLGQEESQPSETDDQPAEPSRKGLHPFPQPSQAGDPATPAGLGAADTDGDLSEGDDPQVEMAEQDTEAQETGGVKGGSEDEEVPPVVTPPLSRQAGPLKMRVDLEALRRRSEEARRKSGHGEDTGKKARFRAATLQRCAVAAASDEGTDTADPAAERELERVFDKADFARMQILGQFNLGFIIARLGQDLFIIDQHASDEKANFERLEASLKLNCQPLLQPRRLELAPLEELHVRENLDVFKANGFEFVDDAQGHLALSAVPFSKGVVFGEADIQELIGLVEAGLHAGTPSKTPGSLLRPSRVRAVLASRACRSSIMIGKHLSHSTMQRVVSTLAGLKSPWNCPHGRPTMRHLWLLPD